MANNAAANIYEKVTGQRKLYDTSTKIPCQSQGVLTGSTKDLTEGFHNLKTLSIEQLFKIAGKESIERQLAKQLERKHRRELLHHLLRQKEEMNELEKHRNIARKSYNLDEGQWTGVSSVRSQPTSLSSLLMSQVPENDEKCEEPEGANELDVPLWSEFSKMGAEMPMGEKGVNINGMLLEEDQKIARLLRNFSLNDGSDADLGSRLYGTRHKNKDVLLNQPAPINGTRVSKRTPPKKLQQNRQSAHRQSKKFNTKSFKTKVCQRWAEFGNCAYGESCPFPHGAKELRMQEMNRKNFKTVWCKKFLAGYCPYGPRCCFIHHISEKRIRSPSRSNYLPPGRNLTPNWMGRNGNEFGAYVPNGVYPPNGAFATRPPRCMDMSRFAYCPGRHPMVFNRPHTW